MSDKKSFLLRVDLAVEDLDDDQLTLLSNYIQRLREGFASPHPMDEEEQHMAFAEDILCSSSLG
jgi:hypothetical protein